MLSDDILREKLSKYMAVVPPVTASTRALLSAKLQKFEAFKDIQDMSSKQVHTNELHDNIVVDPIVENIESTENIENIAPTHNQYTYNHNSENINVDEIVDKTLEKSAGFQPGVLYNARSERIRRFPATELPAYSGEIPVYRRRSLHPMQSDLTDPYEEIVIRSPRLQAQIDSSSIISRALRRSNPLLRQNTSSFKKTSRLLEVLLISLKLGLTTMRRFFRSVFGIFISYFYLPLSLLHVLSEKISLISWRTVGVVIILLALVILMVTFYYSDPFYYNPVIDFEAQLSMPSQKINV